MRRPGPWRYRVLYSARICECALLMLEELLRYHCKGLLTMMSSLMRLRNSMDLIPVMEDRMQSE
jgi:hypothetical protein